MNALNAPSELCNAVQERFQAFLNGFVVTDQADAEPSQSITHSQGSGGGRALPLQPLPGWGPGPWLLGNLHDMLDTLAGRRPLPAGFEWPELPAPAGGRPSQPQRFYVEQLATMKERELKCLYVNFEHVAEFDQVGGGGRAAAAGGLVLVAGLRAQPCCRTACTVHAVLMAVAKGLAFRALNCCAKPYCTQRNVRCAYGCGC